MAKQITNDPGKPPAMKSQGGRNPLLEVSTHAGVAKIFMKDREKISKAPKETLTSSGNTDLEFRKAKETEFMKEIQKTIEEQVAAVRGRRRLGKDCLSEEARTDILQKRLHRDTTGEHEDIKDNLFAVGQRKLTSWRLLRNAGQGPEGVPHFHFYSSFNLEFRKRVFKLFQQAARKVVIRCRANRRLVCLRELMRNYELVEETEKSDDISPKTVFTFAFPIFSSLEEPLSPGGLDKLIVPPVDSNVTVRVPFFKLEIPLHYQLMGYQPVSTWEAFTSYIPTELARPLRTEKPAANEEEESMEAEDRDESVDVPPQTDEVEGGSEIPNTNETTGVDSAVEESHNATSTTEE